MTRSVVRKPSVRCNRCLLPPRWCICGAQKELTSPLSIALLSHQREFSKPSSTGRLIKRLLPATTQHRWDPAAPVTQAQIAQPERELWILHPLGEPLPDTRLTAPTQVLLLDGSWSESTNMMRYVSTFGRLIKLNMSGSSRFWLRAQQSDEKFSTMEALLFLLDALQLPELSHQLRLQFELHVYAGLRSRGQNQLAANFLSSSPIQSEFSGFLEELHKPRPLMN